jgi:hypothetical protein
MYFLTGHVGGCLTAHFRLTVMAVHGVFFLSQIGWGNAEAENILSNPENFGMFQELPANMET